MAALPCRQLAKNAIASMTFEDGFRRIQLKKVSDPLYVSIGVPEFGLYQTIAEMSYPWQWHYYEEPETKVSGDVVLDVGCAEGLFPLLTQSRAAYVYGFEPLHEFHKGLRRTFQNSRNVEICEMAMSSSCKTMFLREAGVSSTLTTEDTGISVPVATIDSFCEARRISPTYLKADLEGYEMQMLLGARSVIAATKPKIAITTYHVASHAREISSLLVGIRSDYKIRVKGLTDKRNAPLMLHAW